MSLEFKKLSEVTAVENVDDTANVLVEEEGIIKRVPKSKIGGGVEGPIVFRTTSIDSSTGNLEFACNYTFEEILEMYKNYNILPCVLNVPSECSLGIASLRASIITCLNSETYDVVLPDDIILGNSYAIRFEMESIDSLNNSMKILYLSDGSIKNAPPEPSE